MSNEITQTSHKFTLQPTTFEEGMRFATLIAKSSFVPTALRGKVEDIFLTVQMGTEVGLAPLQALQNIAVINGRPSLWGDAMLALVKVHPEFEWIKEESLPGAGEERGYRCEVKRKGHEPHVTTFTVADARIAGLWGKSGPWTTSPKRMCQMRARGFNLRDTFPDALKGIISREEALDYPVVGSCSTQKKKYDPNDHNEVIENHTKHHEETEPLTEISYDDIIHMDATYDPKTGELVDEDDAR